MSIVKSTDAAQQPAAELEKPTTDSPAGGSDAPSEDTTGEAQVGDQTQPQSEPEDQPEGQPQGDVQTEDAAKEAVVQEAAAEAQPAAEVEQPVGHIVVPEPIVDPATVNPSTRYADVLALFSEELRTHIVLLLTSPDWRASGFFAEMLDYVREMSPTTYHDNESGGRGQGKYYRAVVDFINNGCEDWNTAYGVFLGMVNELKDEHVFKATLVNRFLETNSLGQQERVAFRRLNHLFITTSAPATRSATIRMVNLEPALAEGLTDAGRQRVKAYYA